MTGRAVLIRGNALALPLADATVDLIVTSPPYFALRSYQDGGEHYDGQIGAEATPAEFVDALIDATREMVRVLKPSGSIFVNLGDKYAGSTGRSGSPSQLQGGTSFRDGQPVSRVPRTTVRPKSLIGIPWRYALRCVDELGLILRAEIIWAKPNGLPESVTDRVSRKHEQFFHFVKSERYYANVDAIRESHKVPLTGEQMAKRVAGGKNTVRHNGSDGAGRQNGRNAGHDPASFSGSNPLGKIPGSWWSIPTQGLRVPPELGVDHFAAFPMEWPRRLVIGWSPPGICIACGEGRRATTERTFDGPHNATEGSRQRERSVLTGGTERVTLGVTDRIRRIVTGERCACRTPDAPTRPAVVLDPFGGTGTTAAVAKALGRTGISVDLSNDYLRLADWRCNGAGYDKVKRKVTRSTGHPVKESIGQLSIMTEMDDNP